MLRRRKECDWTVKLLGVSWQDFEPSEATSEKHGQNPTLHQPDGMFSGE